MGIESSLREIKVNFPFGDVNIKAIDASHGVPPSEYQKVKK